ncbi:MAG: hypothetical protein JRE28_07785 [Deltaproteobacteria bacterium]|nr:hypothetical protein [Deltaproteobacteria bacterium]
MSVIFKTLKKLKTESTDKENGKNKWVRRKRIYFFKHSLYSSYSVLVLLLILTVVGAGTLYGYYHLRETTSENIKGFAVPSKGIQKLTDVDTAESSEDKESKNQKGKKDSGLNRVEYIPPRANDNKVEVYSSNKPDDAGMPFTTARKTSPKLNESIKRNTVAKIKRGKAEKPLAAVVSPVSEVEKIFLANAKKNAKLASLVADIRWEMEHGNKKRTEKLLDELAILKGQNNTYVIKLKSVWHMHNKEYERAKDLLKIVLTKNEFDQEAGINMAIIEINTRQMENACQRLAKLQILYPENIRISEILQDLKRLFNKAQKYHLSQDKES